MNRIDNNVRTCVSIFLCSLLLSACATTAPQSEGIEQRAQARWDAVLSDDLLAAYEFLSPGFRSGVTASQYQRYIMGKQVEWTGARYVKSDCLESTCKVTISLDYAILGALPGVKRFDATKDIEESWLMVDKVWYLVPES